MVSMFLRVGVAAVVLGRLAVILKSRHLGQRVTARRAAPPGDRWLDRLR